MSEIKPCPFCGMNKTSDGRILVNTILHHPDCYMLNQSNIEAWNRRAVDNELLEKKAKMIIERSILRDWFAGQALVGVLCRGACFMNEDKAAEWTYSQADAMLKARMDKLARLLDVKNADIDGLAHEIFAAAQLLPNEGITDAVDRIKECILSEANTSSDTEKAREG